MLNGIALFGLNGGGKSTLAHALAKQISYFEIDVEDYYFPEQRKSRKWAMEHDEIMVTEHLGDIPFSSPRTKEEVQDMLLKDMQSRYGKAKVSTKYVSKSAVLLFKHGA